MSLDVFVTPMWRFKADDVETAVQTLFSSHTRVITPQGILSPQTIKGFFAKRRAKREVRKIVREAEEKLNTRLEWNDDGDTVYSQQAWWRFEALRAFAKWLDLQDHFPAFDDPPKGNFYEHPAMKWKEESRSFRFSHIIDHSCYSGYFVPCRFDRVVYVEPYQSFGGRFTFYHSFGSTYTLADQLKSIEAHIPAEKAASVSETTGRLIRTGFETLNKLSAESIKHQLPIIFWG